MPSTYLDQDEAVLTPEKRERSVSKLGGERQARNGTHRAEHCMGKEREAPDPEASKTSFDAASTESAIVAIYVSKPD